jgi:hypothetical protein
MIMIMIVNKITSFLSLPQTPCLPVAALSSHVDLEFTVLAVRRGACALVWGVNARHGRGKPRG